MHLRTGDAPYSSLSDALAKYPETASAVATQLRQDGEIALTAPLGLSDLLALRVRPSDHFLQHADRYEERLAEKNWLQTWPDLRIVHLDPDVVGQ
jgi:hypothetical protein